MKFRITRDTMGFVAWPEKTRLDHFKQGKKCQFYDKDCDYRGCEGLDELVGYILKQRMLPGDVLEVDIKSMEVKKHEEEVSSSS